MQSTTVPFVYKLRAFLYTAANYWLSWTLFFIKLFVYSPLLVFAFLMLEKQGFSFSVFVRYCHDYYHNVFPILGFLAGLFYTFRFDLRLHYLHHISRMLPDRG